MKTHIRIIWLLSLLTVVLSLVGNATQVMGAQAKPLSPPYTLWAKVPGLPSGKLSYAALPSSQVAGTSGGTPEGWGFEFDLAAGGQIYWNIYYWSSPGAAANGMALYQNLQFVQLSPMPDPPIGGARIGDDGVDVEVTAVYDNLGLDVYTAVGGAGQTYNHSEVRNWVIQAMTYLINQARGYAAEPATIQPPASTSQAAEPATIQPPASIFVLPNTITSGAPTITRSDSYAPNDQMMATPIGYTYRYIAPRGFEYDVGTYHTHAQAVAQDAVNQQNAGTTMQLPVPGPVVKGEWLSLAEDPVRAPNEPDASISAGGVYRNLAILVLFSINYGGKKNQMIAWGSGFALQTMLQLVRRAQAFAAGPHAPAFATPTAVPAVTKGTLAGIVQRAFSIVAPCTNAALQFWPEYVSWVNGGPNPMSQLPSAISTCDAAGSTFHQQFESVQNPNGGDGAIDNIATTLPIGVRNNKVLLRFLTDLHGALGSAGHLLMTIYLAPQYNAFVFNGAQLPEFNGMRSLLKDADAQAAKLR